MDIAFPTEQGKFNYRVAGVWIENGHVLLHKDSNDTNWSLPGGRVKMTEESKVALKREFKEELNLDIKVHRMYWVIENFFTYKDTDFHEIGFYYGISSNHPIIVDQYDAFYGTEGKRLIYQWLPIKRLNEIALDPHCLSAPLQEIPEHTAHLVER